MPIVYLVQSCVFDTTPAAAYGSVKQVLEGKEHLRKDIWKLLGDRLASFTDEDYILPVGDPAAIGAVCAEAAHQNHGRYKVLRWDRFKWNYKVVQVDMAWNCTKCAFEE